jgi:FkbM family methyltransferase
MRWLLDRLFIKKPRFRQFVTRLIEGNRLYEISVLGTSLTVHSIKEHGYLRASRLVTKSSLLGDEAAVLINLAGLLQDDCTFVDIGANVGVFSLTLARLRAIYPSIRFYAFEANPDTFDRLKVRAAQAGVAAYNVALSSKDGRMMFVRGAVSHVFTTVENVSAYSLPGETSEIECKRLDQFHLPRNKLVLKIDVEGQEHDVLEGAARFFEEDCVKAVYLDGYKEKKVEAFLKRYGFRFFDGRTLQPSNGGFSLLALK